MAVEHRLPYRLDVAINRTLRALGSRERTVSRGGLRFRVRRLTSDELFVEKVVVQREYLQHGLTLRPGDTVVDVGGNIGTFAVLAAQEAARVITLEPDATNVRLLRQNVALNKLQNVTIVQAALADSSGKALLFDGGQGGYHTFERSRVASVAGTRPVRTVSLEEVFDDHEVVLCSLLKMDCEGGEFASLPNLPLHVWQRIAQLAMEFHRPRNPEGAEQVERLIAAIRHHFSFVLREDFADGNGGHLFARRS
jgi:FkbM family methyltransferase